MHCTQALTAQVWWCSVESVSVLGSLIMQQIQQQLQRIGTLVGIKQFDSARMQLREGPTSGLRRTLRETENDFVGVSDSVSRCQHLRLCS